MASLREAISNSVQNFMCSAATDADPFRNWMAQATSGIPGVGSAAAAADNLGDTVGALVCPGPGGGSSGGGGTGATYPPVDNGEGQCTFAYFATLRVQYTYDDGTVLPPSTTSAQFPGPWTQPVIETTINNQGRPQTSVTATYGGGVGDFGSNGGNGSNGAEILEFTLTPVNGQPDNCGTPGTQQPPTGNDTIDYDGPDGNPITDAPITINPTFPIIGPGGVLNMPIEVCLLAICFDVNFNISTGDITFNFGGEPDASNCCPPGEELPEDGGEDDPPPPENETRYIGVVTTATLNGEYVKATEIGDGNGPELWIPRIGVVRFAIALGGRRSYTVDQPIKQLNQITYVNAPSTAYAWDILPDHGFDITAVGVPVVT